MAVEISNRSAVAHASGAETASGTGDEFYFTTASGITWMLDVTAAATAVGDTLDVFVETTLDGTNWIDVVHFTQVLGNGGAKQFAITQNWATKTAGFETGTALAANAIRGFVGNQIRAKWTIVETTGAAFTFSLVGMGF